MYSTFDIFLSLGLKEITELYSNFVEEQYMSIFAIALPYTDAHRYLADLHWYCFGTSKYTRVHTDPGKPGN